jgi:hypothetical protein
VPWQLSQEYNFDFAACHLELTIEVVEFPQQFRTPGSQREEAPLRARPILKDRI